ncbi:hypothetical protein L2E82_45574 [Cichorium intybus]|uniref:Uncharacterized protein n=1 Tax=Cichorium intybus TaxID=13427 RepID=A0ACB8ZTG6_CICIN|nr:hypothetical protein L2E82_45574 [Cichorium intybus]
MVLLPPLKWTKNTCDYTFLIPSFNCSLEFPTKSRLQGWCAVGRAHGVLVFETHYDCVDRACGQYPPVGQWSEQRENNTFLSPLLREPVPFTTPPTSASHIRSAASLCPPPHSICSIPSSPTDRPPLRHRCYHRSRLRFQHRSGSRVLGIPDHRSISNTFSLIVSVYVKIDRGSVLLEKEAGNTFSSLLRVESASIGEAYRGGKI